MGCEPGRSWGRHLILIDTHVWIQWANGESRIRPRQLQKIHATPAPERLVHAFSLWEIALLVERDRIDLGAPLEIWFT